MSEYRKYLRTMRRSPLVARVSLRRLRGGTVLLSMYNRAGTLCYTRRVEKDKR